MMRAVAIVVAVIWVANHGILVSSGTSASATASAARPERQRANNSPGPKAAPSLALTSAKPAGSAAALDKTSANPTGSVAASRVTWSVQARWAIWWEMVHPGAGVS